MRSRWCLYLKNENANKKVILKKIHLLVFSYRKWRNSRDMPDLHVKIQQRQTVFITAVSEVTAMMAPFQSGSPNFKYIPKF